LEKIKDIVVVFSDLDPVGRGVFSYILSMSEASRISSCGISMINGRCYLVGEHEIPFVGFNVETVNLHFLDKVFPDAKAYIVISKHSSESGKPTLSLHYPGNIGPYADLGGRPRELAWTWPSMFKNLALEYWKEAVVLGLPNRFEFSVEATHHGPTELSKPIIFIEIGSTKREWNDPEAQITLARALWRAVENYYADKIPHCKPSIGIGGPHYSDRHTKLLLETDICYGHIFARYTFNWLDKEIIQQAIEKSIDPIETIILLKVRSSIKKLVAEIAEENNLSIIHA